MTAAQIRQKYLDFFKARGHVVIPPAPLVPENDPTVLFTTAGMQPLVPYLLGQPHPDGSRLVDYQKCVRTNDIDEVGDTFHHTFFEMLGNWSLGDYFKKEMIPWSFEFLTKDLDLDAERIYISCFAGDQDAPRDEESARIWESLGISRDRIYFFGKSDNWWGPAGQTGPCGPDTEMHYDVTQVPCGPDCKPGDNCGRFSEIWNDVFMEYNKTADGKFEKLPKPNVDTGMGLERIAAVLNGFDDNYLTDLWQPIIKTTEKVTGKKYNEALKPFRIVADHLRAAVFIISDGVQPSNKERGYVLRRLLRRAAMQLYELKTEPVAAAIKVADSAIETMITWYPNLDKDVIDNTIKLELTRFQDTLKRGLPEFEARFPKKYLLASDEDANKLIGDNLKSLNIDQDIFFQKLEDFTSLLSVAAGTAIFQGSASYGIPPDLIMPRIKDWVKGEVVRDDIEKTYTLLAQLHQDLSRKTSSGMFKGGLQDQSETTTKYHTATHLIHASLRKILGDHVQQKGSNITAERLRFDFSHPQKLTDNELKQVEDLVNQKITEAIKVDKLEMDKDKALSMGALAFFPEKYPAKTSVYKIGDFSLELCGGPHVQNTSEIGRIKLTRQEKIGAGVQRLYAQLE